MNGWAPTTPQETRISNLFAQIPQEYQARATRECYGTDDHEFERNLIAYVRAKVWETYESPIAEASRIDAELFLHAAQEPTQPIFTNDPNCTHEKAYAIIGGMMCKCGAKFQPRNEFEQRLVNARNPRGSGYVNWQFR